MRRLIACALSFGLIASPVWAKTDGWVRSGAMAARNLDPKTAGRIENATVRQTIRLTAGGEAIRVRLSNEHGSAPFRIGKATVRVGEVFYPLSFGGRDGMIVPVGAPVVSDVLPIKLAPLTVMEVNLYLPEVVVMATVHGDPKNQAAISAPGDFTHAVEFPTAKILRHKPFLTAVDVLTKAPARTIVAFGDSITDPDCTFGTQLCRWSDVLAERLIRAGKPYAVSNAAISGNRVLTDAYGISALARFDRDVLAVPGVSHVIILEGINDIGNSGGPPLPAADLIAGYKQLIDRARGRGIKVYGAEILPFKGSRNFTAEREVIRLEVNHWIRTSGAFDALIPFSKAVADPLDPSKLNDILETGDNLHPNDAGQRAMGESIDLRLF